MKDKTNIRMKPNDNFVDLPCIKLLWECIIRTRYTSIIMSDQNIIIIRMGYPRLKNLENANFYEL